MAAGRTRTRLAGFALLIVAALQPFECEGQSPFVLTLSDGSRFTAEVDSSSLNWTTVNDDGTMEPRNLRMVNIASIELTAEPASNQVARVRQLIAALGSEDFESRQSAEDELTLEEVGGAYRSLLELHRNSDKLEVRYRIDRILKNLGGDTGSQSDSRFDRLTLTDGTQLDGDAGELSLICALGSREFSLDRTRLKQIERVEDGTAEPYQLEGNVEVQVFQRYQDEFYGGSQTLIDFENDADGVSLARNDDLTRAFVPFGLKLNCEQPGYIGISGYGFRFANDAPETGGNSACVFATGGTLPKRFEGDIEISFCMPGHPERSAGVNEFGVFAARSEHFQDFILEAYNADGELLATVEGSDSSCPFFGIKSNEPVARITIRSNPHLFRISRVIDANYAIDNICFSSPVPVSGTAGGGQPQLTLKNGDSYSMGSFQFSENSITTDVDGFDEPFTFPLNEVAGVYFGREERRSIRDTEIWLAMLGDRSLIKFVPGDSPRWIDWPQEEFDLQQVVAFGSIRNPIRYPQDVDFDEGSYVLSFPTCRIAANELEFGMDAMLWNEDAVKLRQDYYVSGDQPDEDEEDPTPDYSQIDYDADVAGDIPTFWLARPPARDTAAGVIKLRDGQQFVLGKESGFAVDSISDRAVVVSRNGQALEIPWPRVRAIQFPR
ncbi:MAG: hypothetical protein AAF456_09655 [Planctomycetota bacterium]